MNDDTINTTVISQWLKSIIEDDHLHAKWLNTLSFMENCGARMISLCEHPTKVKEEMLKHAAEEFRHAYYLKRQIRKLSTVPLPDYSLHLLLGCSYSKHYLQLLNNSICRFLSKNMNLKGNDIKSRAYLLVTYAIEVRASLLYPLYHEALTNTQSNISMRAIIAEEETHLKDIENELQHFPNQLHLKEMSLSFENQLFHRLFEKLLLTTNSTCAIE